MARLRVIPDSAQRIEHDGIHHVEEQVVVSEVFDAPMLYQAASGVPPNICCVRAETETPARGRGKSYVPAN